MKKRRAKKKRKSQHDKFVEAAHAIGADESEEGFKYALKKIATPAKPFAEPRNHKRR